jgi:hypothetical protein
LENGKMVIRSGFRIPITLRAVLKKIIPVAAGALGIAVSVTGIMTGLPSSLLMGVSAGVIISTLTVDRAMKAFRPGMPEVPYATKQQQVKLDHKGEEPKDSETLKEFDQALASMRRKSGSSQQVVDTMDKAMSKLYAEYPEWDGEGRLRTYTVLKRVSDLLDHDNASQFMAMTFRMLQSRNDEAADYTRTLLNGKVEKMYEDPQYQNMKYLAGTLIAVNRRQKEFVENIITDAIHLWSEPRFEALKPELKMLRTLEQEDKNSIRELVKKEMAKAQRANDPQVAARARAVIRAMSEPKRQTPHTIKVQPVPVRVTPVIRSDSQPSSQSAGGP